MFLSFGAALFYILRLRIERGDVYPPYSTFRPDPFGGKALYDSLSLQPDLALSRNSLPLQQLDASSATLMILGVAPGMEEAVAKPIEEAAKRGARIVIAFLPIEPAAETRKKPEPLPKGKTAEPVLLQRLGVTA